MPPNTRHGGCRPPARVTPWLRTRGALAGSSYDCADEVAVLDGSRLVGLVPLRRLLRADGDATVADLMDPDPPVLGPGVSEESAAWTMGAAR
jgi:Mg/Co/Ni transporter MgtE